MRICGVRIERITDTEGPWQFGSDFPSVLHIEIEIEEVEGFVLRDGKGLQRRRGYSMNELRQSRVGYSRHGPFAEVIIIQPKDSSIRPNPQFVRAARPGKIVIDKKKRRTPSLYPGVV